MHPNLLQRLGNSAPVCLITPSNAPNLLQRRMESTSHPVSPVVNQYQMTEDADFCAVLGGPWAAKPNVRPHGTWLFWGQLVAHLRWGHAICVTPGPSCLGIQYHLGHAICVIHVPWTFISSRGVVSTVNPAIAAGTGPPTRRSRRRGWERGGRRRRLRRRQAGRGRRQGGRGQGGRGGRRLRPLQMISTTSRIISSWPRTTRARATPPRNSPPPSSSPTGRGGIQNNDTNPDSSMTYLEV